MLATTYFFGTMDAMGEETLLTVQEAAKYLDVGETAIRNAMLQGRMAFVLRYGRKLVEKQELDAYRARTRPYGEKSIGRPKRQRAA